MAPKSRRFLVVDDSPTMVSLVKVALKQLGYTDYDEAHNGKLALEKIINSQQSGQPYDLVLCDINMPEMDGIELLNQCRSHSDVRMTPFLMITTESAKPTVIKTVMSGISGYVVKPFEINEIKEKIETILKRIEIEHRTAPQ